MPRKMPRFVSRAPDIQEAAREVEVWGDEADLHGRGQGAHRSIFSHLCSAEAAGEPGSVLCQPLR